MVDVKTTVGTWAGRVLDFSTTPSSGMPSWRASVGTSQHSHPWCLLQISPSSREVIALDRLLA